MKKQRTIIASVFFAAVPLFCALSLYSFEWPQPSEKLAVFFAQRYGDTFSRGLIFNNPAEVKAADSGDILITIKSDTADQGSFPSTLGDAVIISHKNQILTVYGGLEKKSADDGSGYVENATVIGVSGNSGWKENTESLQFQVIDTKIKAVINPLILMDSTVGAKKLVIKNVRAVNKNGNTAVLTNGMNINTGTYTLYMNKPLATMPYTTSVSVNGTLIAKTDYTALKTYRNKLCIQGGEHYSFSAIYPEKNNIRLAEISLAKGKNTIDVSAKDIGAHETSVHITVNAF